jgi:hypothetical protein
MELGWQENSRRTRKVCSGGQERTSKGFDAWAFDGPVDISTWGSRRHETVLALVPSASEVRGLHARRIRGAPSHARRACVTRWIQRDLSCRLLTCSSHARPAHCTGSATRLALGSRRERGQSEKALKTVTGRQAYSSYCMFSDFQRGHEMR